MNVSSFLSRRPAGTDDDRAAVLRRRYRHLVWDIAWYGILNGSAIAFVAVYAARLGASALALGLLSASPAMVNLMVALPAGRWLQRRPLTRAVFRSAMLHRWFYLLWVFLPLALEPRAQVATLIAITVLMSIPGTALAIGFNALYAAAVPETDRGRVAGRRNAAFAVASIIATVIAGFLLSNLPFPLGYQMVFAIGFLAAVASSLHLRAVQVTADQTPRLHRRLGTLAATGAPSMGNVPRFGFGLRAFMSAGEHTVRRVRALGHFRTVLLLVLLLYLTLFLAAPLFPLYFVQALELSDRWIGIGNGVFYLALFVGSFQLDGLSRRAGHRGALALGMSTIAFYPALLALAGTLTVRSGLTLYLAASVVGGVAWSLVFGSLGNYVLQIIPEEARPTYLALHNMALQGGILLGSLLASLLADWLGLTGALLLAAAARAAVGLLLWRWG